MRTLGDLYEISIWKAEWAHKLLQADTVFRDVEKEDFLEGICCVKCFGRDCNSLHCCWMCETFDEEEVQTNEKRDKKDSGIFARVGEAGKRVTGDAVKKTKDCLSRLGDLSIWFTALYVLHLGVTIPFFYLTLTISAIMSVVFRITRSITLEIIRIAKSLSCCGFQKLLVRVPHHHANQITENCTNTL
jgi:hypothetical protein